ncbi:hypothetical protein P7G87_01000 [Enterococcus asini]|uniref:Uncharacterized protein n=2 Tax=Enterococcus asini TaxID=57732 RepID=R2PYI4_9ENTE|nr:hypothetical protein [Enterococcus asini]EOH88243.1 hypothetical protein UAS_01004 [Enterococcus asini ATCC 700915]EOT56040.1 hypothetical protein I579_02404 [Enterococcus asini ATCC 700915]MCD5028533.1 hypothetical protein [Enterococcus asini]MDT2743098.1 hypothetical protein [Enterococcus asini]MDT2763136.1 hypothetical protein [Enterococcus asini]
MFYQKAYKVDEMARVLANVSECFFIIQGHFINKEYRVAVYKYDHEYFLLRDHRIFLNTAKTKGQIAGDENLVLPYIEEALEENKYLLIDKAYLRLELAILDKMSKHNGIDIQYFEFVD